MKSILIILTIGLIFPGEAELGLGIVAVDIYHTKEIKVFASKGDKAPEKTIRLTNNNSEIRIEDKNYTSWLKPEAISLDYSIFLFRYTRMEGNWVEVVVNYEAMTKKWIQKTETLSVKPWEKFLIENTTAIDPLLPVEIKIEPNTDSRTIRKSTKEDCFEAIEIKGDWMRVRTNETLDCSEHPTPIQSGWIRWRLADQLLIKYYLTC
jgi:hypothetical protein